MVDFIVGRAIRSQEIPEGLELDIGELFDDWMDYADLCEKCEVYREKMGDPRLEELLDELDDDEKLEVLLDRDSHGVESALREKLEELSDEEIRKIYCQGKGGGF